MGLLFSFSRFTFYYVTFSVVVTPAVLFLDMEPFHRGIAPFFVFFFDCLPMWFQYLFSSLFPRDRGHTLSRRELSGG